jgi:hypothetical protein
MMRIVTTINNKPTSRGRWEREHLAEFRSHRVAVALLQFRLRVAGHSQIVQGTLNPLGGRFEIAGWCRFARVCPADH